jgi:hypothetical protein
VLVLLPFAARAKHKLLLLAPAALVLAAGMASSINIGIRHMLPLWPFVIVAGVCGAWPLVQRTRLLQLVAAALLLFHIVSTLVAAPHFIAYANELWGGTDRTHRLLKDSNVEWGQNTHLVREYVEANGIRDCWFASYGHGAISRALQPCHLLPALGWTAGTAVVDPLPQVIRGTVFVSAAALPPRGSSDYHPIVTRPPDAILGGSILVYTGEFHVPALAARVEAVRRRQLALRAR